jgi:hypothetical protein
VRLRLGRSGGFPSSRMPLTPPLKYFTAPGFKSPGSLDFADDDEGDEILMPFPISRQLRDVDIGAGGSWN